MAKPFYDRLKEYYEQAGKVLRGEAEAASIFPNSTDVGVSRENVYAEFLRLHIPSGCNVALGGFIFGKDGAESAQIDVLVTSDAGLQYNLNNRNGLGKTFACVDTTVAVVSVKSTLDSRELINALDNLATIPMKTPMAGRFSPGLSLKASDYDDWPFKIIYARDGIALDTLTDTLLNYYRDHADVPSRLRPNLIHVAGKYSIQRDVHASKKKDRSVWPANQFHPFADPGDSFALVYAVTKIQTVAMAHRFLLQNFADIADKIPFPTSGEPRWGRVK